MANLINADPTNGLKLISDGSSEIQMQANGVTIATINSSGLSMNSGTMAGNGPAFSAYPSAGVTLTAGTWTKVPFNVENFDTNSCYDITNYRFTPNVAGYYHIGATIAAAGGGNATYFLCAIYKNGSAHKYGSNFQCSASSGPGTNVSALVYANGSTDYFELYEIHATGSTSGSGALNFFDGYLARAA